ncbi:hypothetical protein O181_025173 [Austropuccinia psidii MF-1]|uniref:Uncharacterized protein n=1 Tax=Austropuccinia psidii MF-1 TaxID=1389203 RepID=A0A9Q3CM73_9BASI|nr:hypothetical protein [Austropuccinia psidii MF-1]
MVKFLQQVCGSSLEYTSTEHFPDSRQIYFIYLFKLWFLLRTSYGCHSLNIQRPVSSLIREFLKLVSNRLSYGKIHFNLIFSLPSCASALLVILFSILSLLGLIVFNTLTQGWDPQTESVLKGHWYPKNDTLNCQPAVMAVGNTFFTNRVSNSSISSQMKDDEDPRGSFPWSIQGVLHGSEGRDAGETGFQYQETPLKCNITYITLSYDFRLQGFSYSMAAMCSTQSVKVESEDNYVILSTHFEIANNNLPKFTQKVQNSMQQQIYGISKYYPQLNFSRNSLNGSSFPPYSLVNNTLANESVLNRDILQWAVWLDGFNYTLAENYQEFNYSKLKEQPEPQGKMFLAPNDTQPTDFAEATLKLLARNPSCGLQINAEGIGGIRPIPLNASSSEVSELPAPLPLYINLTQSILATMMDMAGKDVSGRVLGVSYLCTSTSSHMKKPWRMLALLFGSCSGAFGVAWTFMIFISRSYDTYLTARKTESLQNSQRPFHLTEKKQLIQCIEKSEMA